MRAWIAESLSRKLVAGLAMILAGASLVFLFVFVWLYQDQLEKERATASTQVNFLLQAALENAMLKRDLVGLRRIVRRLGRQESIRRVMIVNPDHEVRFSSDPSLLNRTLPDSALSGCETCTTEKPLRELARFMTGGTDGEVLRSVNPIHNKLPCTVCHGHIDENPVNGIMIVDYEASGIREEAMRGAAGLAGAGALVVLVALGAAWLFLSRAVLVPVGALNVVSRRLGKGDFSVRAPCEGRDELAQLCGAFNRMATRLEGTLNDLKSHEDFLQSLIDAVPDGIRVIDADFRIRLANDAYCRQVGADRQEVTGSYCYRSSHGRDEPCLPSLTTCPVYELGRNGKPIKVMHNHQTGEEEDFPVEIYAAPLTIQREGREERLVVEAIRDLAQQVRISQEQRMSELGQLATGVAHEIHNPLASVRLGLQSLMKSAKWTDDNKDLFGYLQQVDGEVDKCIEVTERLLNLSVPPSDYLQLVSLKNIIPDVVSLLRYEAEKSSVEVEMDLGERLLRVLATDSEMRMLSLNLIQNAFHAMPEGGTLRIRGEARENKAIITYADTGVGIDPEYAAHIFDPFFSRRADHVSGTGLGLTICKAIAERYQGSVRMSSKPGEGSTFTVIMPLADKGETA